MAWTQTRRGTRWAIAASVVVHLCVLTALLLQRWTLDLPPDELAGPPEPIIPVLLVPHAPVGARGGSLATGKLRLHQRRLRAEAPPLPSAARPLLVPQDQPKAATSAALSARPQSAAEPTAGAPSEPGPPGPDLRLALRHGPVGCANAAAVGMNREERQRCEDRLGAGAKHEAVLAEGRDPRIQAYFDAVAKAKAPDKPWTPTRAIGAMGIGQDVPRYSNDRLPMIGCAIPFGSGEKRKIPSHWLKLGPCIIAPPKGPFTVEADITPPDQDLSHPPPRSGPQPAPQVRHEIAASAPASRPTLERDKGKDADGEKPPR